MPKCFRLAVAFLFGNHRGPSLAFTTEAIVVTSGVGPVDQQFGPNTLRSWRSTDLGKTWTSGPDLSTRGTGGMGFQAIASDGKRKLVAAWIGPQDGAPRLFVAHSNDAGLTWSKQNVLSQTVCECCHPTVSIAADRAVHILFRNSLGGNRDFYLATARDGEHFEIAKLGLGSWKINACPMDGGSMGEFHGDVITLWRREGNLFLARPDGQAEQFLAKYGRIRRSLGAQDGYYAMWSTPEGLLAESPGTASTPFALQIRLLSGNFQSRRRVVAAWEDNGRIVSERLAP